MAFTVARLRQSPSLLSSDSFHMKCLSSILPCLRLAHCLSWPAFFGSLFFSLARRCLMMVIFYPGPSVSWCGEALGPPAVPDEAWWEITQSSLLSDCNSLFGCNKQANPCTGVHAHKRMQTPLIVCINYTVWDHHGDHSCVGHALLSGSLGSSTPHNSYSTVAVRHSST